MSACIAYTQRGHQQCSNRALEGSPYCQKHSGRKHRAANRPVAAESNMLGDICRIDWFPEAYARKLDELTEDARDVAIVNQRMAEAAADPSRIVRSDGSSIED